MATLAEKLARLANDGVRGNAIDAEWTVRPGELAFREAQRGVHELAPALVAALRLAPEPRARFLLWLTLPIVREEDLAYLCSSLDAVADADSRLLATFFLLGRLRGAPDFWCAAASATLDAVEGKISRRQEPVSANVRAAVEAPGRFSPDAAVATGIALFERGKFFEAHEVWEDVWRPSRDPDRDFFRGLIDLAVAMSKAREGNANGVIRLADRAESLLTPFSPAHRGIDVTALLASIRHAREEARALASGSSGGVASFPIPRTR